MIAFDKGGNHHENLNESHGDRGNRRSGVRRRSTATAEIYDPWAQTWTATASMQAARAQHAAALLKNGRVLVMGGSFWENYPVYVVELYRP